MLVAHVDVRYIRGFFGNERASGRIRSFHKRAWCVSAFARERRRERVCVRDSETEERTRAESGNEWVWWKSDSQLVVAHISACHGYLTRGNIGWDRELSCLVSDLASILASIVADALNLPDLIFLRSNNFGSSCSLFLRSRLVETNHRKYAIDTRWSRDRM